MLHTTANARHANRAAIHDSAESADKSARSEVEVGATVTAIFGRGQTKRAVTGTVVCWRDAQNGRWVMLQVGQGFATQFLRVRSINIVGVQDDALAEAA